MFFKKQVLNTRMTFIFLENNLLSFVSFQGPSYYNSYEMRKIFFLTPHSKTRFANNPLRIIYKNSVISHFFFTVSLYIGYTFIAFCLYIFKLVSYLPFHQCHLIYSVYAQFWPCKRILFYTLSEPNIYKPYGFFLGFLTTLLLRIPVVLSFIHCGKIN